MVNRGVFYNSLLGCPDISFMGGGVSENADARQKTQQGGHFARLFNAADAFLSQNIAA